MKVGDVVRLKSGGPAMTIFSVLNDGTFICKWFTEDNLVLNSELFNESTLVIF